MIINNNNNDISTIETMKGNPNVTFGGMVIDRQGLMPDHWQKQNKQRKPARREVAEN